MTITFFVPARGGSKGIKDKNVTLLCGKPLIYWVLNALEKSDYADKNIVVATDSEKIKQTVLNFGFSDVQVYDRNIVNAQDTSTTIEVVLEYIEAKKLADENPNIKMALQEMTKVTKWASFPGANGLQAEQLLIDARDIILSGKMSAQDALHQTAEKINKLL